MGILIVDDSENTRSLLEFYLKGAGYEDVFHAETAPEAFSMLKANDTSKIDLILMDISLPDISGIEACHHIKGMDHHKDTPIVMVTGRTDDTNLQLAFEAGAMDYLTKPINKIELLTRIRAVLKLKHEMDSSKKIARQLEEANMKLQLLSSMDALTGIANRRQFNQSLDKEWRRSLRDNKPLSLIMIDIDCFKLYNDNYGHQAGDDCLKQVASVLNAQARRPGDLVARYGGEEFVIILPDTNAESAILYANRVHTAIDTLHIPHEYSKTAKHITISMGLATVITNSNMTPENLIKLSDDALYQSKQEGRNRITAAKV